MAQVLVTIDNRKYRLACNEGEEARLESLAGVIDEKIGELRASFGEIGDQRLVVMAALTIADSLAEARDAVAAERERADAATARAEAAASSINQLSERIEAQSGRAAQHALKMSSEKCLGQIALFERQMREADEALAELRGMHRLLEGTQVKKAAS
jgi:cell division protein ZapA